MSAGGRRHLLWWEELGMGAAERLSRWVALQEELLCHRQESLVEIDRRLRERYGSRRHFFNEILPVRVVTDVTWGRWVKGDDVPSDVHLRELLPQLRECLDLSDLPTLSDGALDADGNTNGKAPPPGQEAAGVFDLRLAPLDFLRHLTATAHQQAHEADVAEDPAQAPARRRRAIALLLPLADLADSGEPEHVLLGAEASLVLSLLLAQVGKHLGAKGYALLAAHALERVQA
ncbi:MAG: hypothetical protein ACRDJN_16915, partial [Chloroflexota bacterium]